MNAPCTREKRTLMIASRLLKRKMQEKSWKQPPARNNSLSKGYNNAQLNARSALEVITETTATLWS